jgi:hypothetical protein
MKYLLTLFALQLCIISYGQKALDSLKKAEGIWIANDYYDSFEKTNSAIKSKKAFEPNYPVALRINTSEVKNGIMNIGYSVLHDHMLHPEVSEYIVKGGDTIKEQGNFKINLNKKDSIGYYKTTDIYYFNYDWISYFSWNTERKTLTLYRPEGNGHKELFIHFTQPTSKFSDDYPFPNPLYNYTRRKTLVGNYTLKNKNSETLSKNLNIYENGSIEGYKPFESFTAYFSTDIYCGPLGKNDLLILYEDILIEESIALYFLYVKDEKGNINLFERTIQMEERDQQIKLGEKVYELIKN